MPRQQKTQERRLAEQCIQKAQAKMGAGWKLIGKELQWDLIAAQILNLFIAQDDSIPDNTVRRFTLKIISEASSLRDGDR